MFFLDVLVVLNKVLYKNEIFICVACIIETPVYCFIEVFALQRKILNDNVFSLIVIQFIVG